MQENGNDNDHFPEEDVGHDNGSGDEEKETDDITDAIEL